MPTPLGRVVAISEALGLSGVQDILNSAPEPRGSLWNFRPDGLQHLQDSFRINLIYPKRSNGLAIGLEGHFPLGDMLGIAEFGLVAGNVFIGKGSESRY